jgi:UDP-N-acetylmuramoyl-tripeptide--D-alanyl-D-alanine ligase
VQNSLAVLLAARLAGADLTEAAAALAAFQAPAGRGKQEVLHTPSGEAVLFDESYNANPASMRAAFALLGQSMMPGRRIAVLGDMLELGDLSEELHRDLAPALAEARIDLLFAAGPHMRALYDAVPQERRGGWAERAEDLEAEVVESVRGGDVIMIKGSLGSRMGPIVKALTRRFAGGASNPVHA